MNTYDMNQLKGQVKAITYKKAVGKQGKPEVLINMGAAGIYKVGYGSNDVLLSVVEVIKDNDQITIYTKKPHTTFIDLGNTNDVLQISKGKQVVYSLDNPRKSFHTNYMFSLVVSLLLPVAGIFYVMKTKSNNMMEALQAARLQASQLHKG